MNKPIISIITATYNNADTIEDTLLSVVQQTYPYIEYIVKDGGSTDGTLDILSKYRNYIHIFETGKDEGVYSALNKALSLATGDVVGFLHADDYFYSENVIEKIAEAFADQTIVATYSDLIYVGREKNKQIIRYWRSNSYNDRLLYRGWMPPHPTVFFLRKVINKIGLFNEKYRIAADYDFIIRLFMHYPANAFLYIPQITTCMRVGGESNRSIYNIIQKTKEDYKIIQKHRLGGTKTLILKNFSKIIQFIIKK